MNHPSLFWIFCLLVHDFWKYEHGVSFPNGTISCKVSLFITSITLNIWNISFVLLSFLVFIIFVVKFLLLLLLLEVLLGVNCERLIICFSHIFFSSHKSRFFLCTFFSKSTEGDQFPSCTNSLNEWFPWYRETIQGSYYNFSFLKILFYYSKLFFDLRNPCEVRLYSIRVMFIHILQLAPQIHISVDVLPFEHVFQSII